MKRAFGMRIRTSIQRDSTCHIQWVCTSWAVAGTDRSHSCGRQSGSRRNNPRNSPKWGRCTAPPLQGHTQLITTWALLVPNTSSAHSTFCSLSLCHFLNTARPYLWTVLFLKYLTEFSSNNPNCMSRHYRILQFLSAAWGVPPGTTN